MGEPPAGAEPEPRYFDSVFQPVRDEAGRVARRADPQRPTSLNTSGTGSSWRNWRTACDAPRSDTGRCSRRCRTASSASTRDGSVIGANPAAVEIMGLTPGHTPADAPS